MKTNKLILFLAIAIHQQALGQPVVNKIDTITANVISFNGSGFGIKSPAEPILWENFEDGHAGNALPTTGKWKALAGKGGYFSNVVNDHLSVAGIPYSGNLSAYNHFKVGSSGVNEDFNTSYFVYTPTNIIYYSYQWRWESTSTGDERAVIKAGRINSNNIPINYYNGPGNSSISTLSPQSYWNITNSFSTSANSPSVTMNQNINPSNYQHVLDEGSWNRHEIYKKLSTPGLADGEVWFAIGNYVAWRDNAVMNRASGETYQNYSALLGLMVAGLTLGSDTEVRLWVDDVYIDNTQARVEIGNVPVFSECTQREIQIPLSWSENNITVKINRGRFPSGSKLFLFVIDANGIISAGYPITLVHLAPDVKSIIHQNSN